MAEVGLGNTQTVLIKDTMRIDAGKDADSIIVSANTAEHIGCQEYTIGNIAVLFYW